MDVKEICDIQSIELDLLAGNVTIELIDEYAEAIRRECADRSRGEILEYDCDFTCLANSVESAILGAELAQDDEKPDGTELIRRERERQKAIEGWTPDHDDEHCDGELAEAACAYAMGRADMYPKKWSLTWWKTPRDKDGNIDRVRELVKAGALIAAEIDRLMRAAEVKRRIEEVKE